jgi:hypothetical protein
MQQHQANVSPSAVKPELIELDAATLKLVAGGVATTAGPNGGWASVAGGPNGGWASVAAGPNGGW